MEHTDDVITSNGSPTLFNTISFDDPNLEPPGTELMRNSTRHHMAVADEHVLVPTPSNDPADPLNWSTTWKLLIIINQALYVFFGVMPALSIAPLTPVFEVAFGASAATVSLFTGVCIIILGWANFIIIPVSNIYGRRFACLITAAIIIGSNIWQATATTTGSFFGARVMNGLGSAVTESLMVQVVADMFFLHERGRWMGVYFASYFLGLMVGPIIAGNMAEYIGWRNFFWLCTGLSVLNFSFLIILIPETRFHRSGVNGASACDKPAPIEKSGVEFNETTSEADLGSMIGKGKPTRSQWKLIQKPCKGLMSSLARDFVTPVWITGFPIVFWAAIVTGGAANTLLSLNLTQAAVFFPPPYLFSTGDVGFVNFSFVIGGIIGLATAGPLSDWIAAWLTRRNNDIREPEMRLLAMIPYFLIMIIGCAVVAAGYNQAWPWEAIVILGYTCIGIQVVALPTIAVAYAVDSYKPVSGEILVVCTVFKNTFGFAMSWWVPAVTPMQAVLGLFGCNLAVCLIGIPIYFYGKRLRLITKDSKVHLLEEILYRNDGS